MLREIAVGIALFLVLTIAVAAGVLHLLARVANAADGIGNLDGESLSDHVVEGNIVTGNVAAGGTTFHARIEISA